MTKESKQKSLREKINHSLFSLIAFSAILYIGSPIVIPLLIAIVFYLILSPSLPTSSRPLFIRWITSITVSFTIATTFLIFLYASSTPIFRIFQQTSENLSKIERQLIFMKEPIAQLSKAEEKMESFTNSQSIKKPLKVSVEKQTITGSAFSFFQKFVADFFMVLVFLVFFLVYGDQFLKSFARFIPLDFKKKSIPLILDDIKSSAAKYFLAVTLINICLGCAIGGSLYLIGLPNAHVWGTLAAILNFIPYLGCLIGSGLVFIVALPEFELSWVTFAGPGIYFLLNSIEGQLITPVIIGRTFCVNPLIIIITMAYLGLILGIVGLFIAMPLLLVAKVVADNTYSLDSVACFMECVDSKEED